MGILIRTMRFERLRNVVVVKGLSVGVSKVTEKSVKRKEDGKVKPDGCCTTE